MGAAKRAKENAMEKNKVPKGKKDKLLEAAIKLFVRNGYENTSLKDLAKTVGIQAPAIYYYFNSKKEIICEIVDMVWDQYREKVIDKVEAIGDPEEQIRGLVRLMVAFQFEMGATNILFDDPIPVVKTLPSYRKHALEAKAFRQRILQSFAESKGLDKRVSVDILNLLLFQLVAGLPKRADLLKGHSLKALTDDISHLFFYGCYGFEAEK